jgi:ankyrin repeat protein
MKILLLAIFPTKSQSRNPKLATASLLASRIADGKMIHYVDINDRFLKDKRELTKEVMPDGVHPNRNGYRIWAEAIESKVTQLIGDAVVYYAASRGDLTKMEELVRKGIDVNLADAQGRTALHYAAQGGHKDVVELLFAENASVDAKDKDGKTPLELAASQRHSEVVKLLIERGADIPTMHLAASFGRVDKLQSFLKTGMDVDARDKNGQTSLLRAVKSGHMETVGFLIENGADVNKGDTQDYVPLMYALWGMDSDMVELLIEKGADVNAKDTPSGYTSLHWAVMMGSTELTKLILEAGGDANAESETGETPLDLAKQGSSEIVELLKKHMLPHYVKITSLSAPLTCVLGDVLPITVSVANEGDQRDAFRVTLFDAVNNVEVAGREMTLEPQKCRSANAADLILSPPSSRQGNPGFDCLKFRRIRNQPMPTIDNSVLQSSLLSIPKELRCIITCIFTLHQRIVYFVKFS